MLGEKIVENLALKMYQKEKLGVDDNQSKELKKKIMEFTNKKQPTTKFDSDRFLFSRQNTLE